MSYPKSLINWLRIGLLMVLIQVAVGGITRLTESGLSITKWEVVAGIVPPLSQADWDREFELYKATPQYEEVNEGMSLSDFKFIYFWEWVHRFWARFMGFVFIIPYLYFFTKGYIDRKLNLRLLVVVSFAALAGIFGWIMVASGLVERPWVNAYKLSLHLIIAFAVFASLLWTYLYVVNREWNVPSIKSIKVHLYFVTILFVFQLVLGGILSGMKAAVIFPTWPAMNGSLFPSVIFDVNEWKLSNFIDYDKNIFMPSLVHFLHRNIAYVLFIVGVIFCIRFYKSYQQLSYARNISILFITILLSQVILGILTVINSIGKIPIVLGTLHQVFALCLMSCIVYTFFVLRDNK